MSPLARLSSRLITALGSAAIATSASATAFGTVGKVQGLVTVTDGTRAEIVAAGRPIDNGMRFITASNGSASVQLDSGCTVTLQGSQALTVLEGMSCQELHAAVQQLGAAALGAGPAGAVGLATTAGGGLAGIGAIGAAAAAAAGVGVLTKAISNSRSISSN